MPTIMGTVFFFSFLLLFILSVDNFLNVRLLSCSFNIQPGSRRWNLTKGWKMYFLWWKEKKLINTIGSFSTMADSPISFFLPRVFLHCRSTFFKLTKCWSVGCDRSWLTDADIMVWERMADLKSPRRLSHLWLD